MHLLILVRALAAKGADLVVIGFAKQVLLQKAGKAISYNWHSYCQNPSACTFISFQCEFVNWKYFAIKPILCQTWTHGIVTRWNVNVLNEMQNNYVFKSLLVEHNSFPCGFIHYGGFFVEHASQPPILLTRSISRNHCHNVNTFNTEYLFVLLLHGFLLLAFYSFNFIYFLTRQEM